MQSKNIFHCLDWKFKGLKSVETMIAIDRTFKTDELKPRM